MVYFSEQLINGLQYASFLFLLSSGLTLVFGILNIINLAHASFFVVGAYAAAIVMGLTNSLVLSALGGLSAGAAYAVVVEFLIIRHLYNRGHIDQVLATFGVTLVTNELLSILVGRSPLFVQTPPILAGSLPIGSLQFPVIRLIFIAAGVLVGFLLWLLIDKSRTGMLIRAASDDATTLDSLGKESRTVFRLVFALAGVLCGLAGFLAAPILSVELGMGDNILISIFVVIVIGGIGSVRGSMVGALLVGMVDAFGRAYLPSLLSRLLAPDVASTVIAPSVSALVFVVMIAVLMFRPRGLVS